MDWDSDFGSFIEFCNKVKENTGVSSIYGIHIKKAHALLHDKCPRCDYGDITIQDDELGRAYYCNLCPWTGWLPFVFIDSVKLDISILALVNFYP